VAIITSDQKWKHCGSIHDVASRVLSVTALQADWQNVNIHAMSSGRWRIAAIE
jgi:hypothetical protein